MPSDQVAEPTSETSIPDDLKLKVTALKSVVNVHELLSLASLPGSHAERTLVALQFLVHLHQQILTEAKAHEMAHLVPELETK